MVWDGVLTANEARLIRALLRMDRPASGRALARITGLTPSTARRALTSLEAAGLVLAEPAPPSLLYRANRDHLAIPALHELTSLEATLRARIAAQVGRWEPPAASAVLYGSVVRGAASPTSDIDILVVRPDAVEPDEPAWQRQVAELADHVQRWTGRRASIVEESVDEAVHGLAAREPFLVEADRDGWVVAGQSLSRLPKSDRE